MKRNILVAYDGSELSEKAIQEALKQANAFQNVKVYLVAVFSPAGLGTSYPGMTEDVKREMIEKHQMKLDEVAASFTDESMVYTDVLVDYSLRNVGRVIVDYAKEKAIDLIVIGSRGLGGVKGTILGSVSSQVVEHASSNVMIVKS